MKVSTNLSRNIISVICINLLIAVGFFLDNMHAGYSVIVSDVYGIIGIAQKFDNPNLFSHDLFLNSIENVKYYTPFFVQSLRFFAKFTDYNYIQALNVYGLLCNFIFGILWYLLFFKHTRSFWVSLILSILIRGIIWLPGMEIWGIGDIWTIMPRTAYITLMPLPFLLMSYLHRNRLFLSAFLIGLVFNFHPITGLGGILIYVFLLFLRFKKTTWWTMKNVKMFGIVALFIMLGMLPFVVTYFGKTDVALDYDPKLFRDAFLNRIPLGFENPILYLKQWLSVKTLFFLVPLLLYFFLSLKHEAELKRAKLLLFLTAMLIVIPGLSVYVERAINHIFEINLRMSFQFIRIQKIAILPSYFAMAFLLVRLKDRKFVLPGITLMFIALLSVSKASLFNKTPIIGDAIARSILPNSLSIAKDKTPKYTSMDAMMDYIAKNTSQDAVFFGPTIIRGAARRSLVLDHKGASAIIEGNPKQFIDWYLERLDFEKITNKRDKVLFLKKKGVDFFVTKNDFSEMATLVHQIGKVKLFKIE